jgi:bacteriocin biosynthesis cyclodehydratase domain-containing protein
VGIVGTGGLGTWTACGLVCAGLGGLVLIDDDQVEVSNLNRQLLFGEADVGKPKIEAARRALLRHNSGLRVRTVDRRVRGPGGLSDVLDEVDLLIATADWPPYDLPRWINKACLAAGTPYITAGQSLPLSRVGPTVIPGRSACLECEERRHRRTHPLYDELAEFQTANPSDAATVGAACGVVGSMLAMEAIHLLTGAIQPASLDAALVLDLRTMTIVREEVMRDPDCPACGEGSHEK